MGLINISVCSRQNHSPIKEPFPACTVSLPSTLRGQQQKQAAEAAATLCRRPRSFIPLVDFIGKVQKDCVREVLSVSADQFL